MFKFDIEILITFNAIIKAAGYAIIWELERNEFESVDCFANY
jgi:hypothetical protein